MDIVLINEEKLRSAWDFLYRDNCDHCEESLYQFKDSADTIISIGLKLSRCDQSKDFKLVYNLNDQYYYIIFTCNTLTFGDYENFVNIFSKALTNLTCLRRIKKINEISNTEKNIVIMTYKNEFKNGVLSFKE